MSKIPFIERINQGQTLVADGATGTNLIARGLPSGLTPESWVMEKPEKVIQLHREFIQAGADIILTSTFNATPLRMQGTALDGQSEAVNRRAVELAKSAAGDQPVYIAGSLGPVGQLIKPYGPLLPEEVRSAYAQQAHALSEAGVDVLVIETQFDLGEVKAAIQGARESSDLTLVASLSYDRGRRTMMGVSPTQAAKELDNLPIDLIGINCGHSLEENLQNLEELRQVTKKPIWFKPNAGLPHVDADGNTLYDVSPKDMGALAPAWLAAGAQVVGGCCGTTPAHLAAIAGGMKREKD